MSAAEKLETAPDFESLDLRFIYAIQTAVSESRGDDAALGQDVRALMTAYKARESKLIVKAVSR